MQILQISAGEMQIVTDSWLPSIILGDKCVNTDETPKQRGKICHSYWRPGTSLSGTWSLWQHNDEESGN